MAKLGGEVEIGVDVAGKIGVDVAGKIGVVAAGIGVDGAMFGEHEMAVGAYEAAMKVDGAAPRGSSPCGAPGFGGV